MTAKYIASTNPAKWHCICDCGNEVDVLAHRLKSGTTQSCGCIKSKGEQKIQNILQELQLNFKKVLTNQV